MSALGPVTALIRRIVVVFLRSLRMREIRKISSKMAIIVRVRIRGGDGERRQGLHREGG